MRVQKAVAKDKERARRLVEGSESGQLPQSAQPSQSSSFTQADLADLGWYDNIVEPQSAVIPNLDPSTQDPNLRTEMDVEIDVIDFVPSDNEEVINVDSEDIEIQLDSDQPVNDKEEVEFDLDALLEQWVDEDSDGRESDSGDDDDRDSEKDKPTNSVPTTDSEWYPFSKKEVGANSEALCCSSC